MSTGLVTDERYFWIELVPWLPLGPHAQPFPAMDSPDGKRRILNLLRASGITKYLTEIEAREATEEELLRFHTPDYVDHVKAVSKADGGMVGEVTGICAGGYEIACLAVGGCLAAFDAVLTGKVRNAFALVRPCGHHAEADWGRGFAVFGNLTLAILDAKAHHGLGRTAVVDWDVHHGNGTQWAFYDDPGVLTLSIHQDRLYPQESGFLDELGEGRGRGYNINVPLPPGSGHGAYLETMERVVLPALARFKPEMIVIACGLDANAIDPLGRMLCYSETYREMTSMLRAAAEDLCDGRLVSCLEGGYAPAYIPYCGLAVIEAMSGIRTGVEDPIGDWPAGFGGQELQSHQSQLIGRAADIVTSL